MKYNYISAVFNVSKVQNYHVTHCVLLILLFSKQTFIAVAVLDAETMIIFSRCKCILMRHDNIMRMFLFSNCRSNSDVRIMTVDRHIDNIEHVMSPEERFVRGYFANNTNDITSAWIRVRVSLFIDILTQRMVVDNCHACHYHHNRSSCSSPFVLI